MTQFIKRKIKFCLRAVLFCLLPHLLPTDASAELFGEQPVCGSAKAQTVEYKYCLRRSATANSDVIFYLHGGGGDEKQFFRENGFVELFKASFKANGKSMPGVITLSFGPSWLLGDVATPQHPALLPLVANEILPALETKVRIGTGRLFVMGPSMGGYNSALLALRLKDKFAKALPLCPGMLPIPFDATKNQVDAYLKANSPKIIRKALENVLNWVRHDFGTAQVWSRHNPIELAATAASVRTQFYVSSTYDDDYGFYEGAKTFAEKLKTKGFEVEHSFDLTGRHCEEIDPNIPAITRFLIR